MADSIASHIIIPDRRAPEIDTALPGLVRRIRTTPWPVYPNELLG